MEAVSLWHGGPKFIGDPAAPVGTDSVLLADFAAGLGAARAMDLGCGAGILALLLLERSPALFAEGLELRAEAAALARLNLAQNGLAARTLIRCGDIRAHRSLYTAGSFDLVVCNPPYFPAGVGKPSPDPARHAARSEDSCPLPEVCAAAAFLCRNGGSFCLVHRAERMAEVLALLSASGLEPKRLRMIVHSPDASPKLFLVEGRRGAKPGLVIMPQLALKNADGTNSDEVLKIYHIETETTL
ncbi:MAG: methyltransferase [Oscillospiraceae bacterium]